MKSETSGAHIEELHRSLHAAVNAGDSGHKAKATINLVVDFRKTTLSHLDLYPFRKKSTLSIAALLADHLKKRACNRQTVVFKRITDMTNLFKSFIKNKSGATAIEYGLIASLVAVAAITAMSTVGTNLIATFTKIGAKLG